MTETASSNSTPRHRWRRIILIIIFVAINAVAIIATAASEFGNSANAAELSSVTIHWWLLLPAFICFIIGVGFEAAKYVIMMRRLADKHNSLALDAKIGARTVLLGKYYDSLTPASIGGQPFQVFYLHKHGHLKTGIATAIPIFGLISSQIAFLILAIVLFLSGNVGEKNPALLVPAWFGLIFYAFWPCLLLSTSLFPKPTTKFLRGVVKIGAKLRLVKNPIETLAKVEKEVKNYTKSVKYILKAKGLFFNVLVCSLLFQLLTASIPFFVLTAFGGEISYIESLATTIAVMSAVCFIPTPGNVGAAEGAFYVVFSALSEGYVFWAMLTWRFFSYYIYLLLGLVTYLHIHFERKRGIID